MKTEASRMILSGVFAAVILTAPASGEVVHFADPVLEDVVREALGIPRPTPVTAADMLELTELHPANMGIRELGGIEYALNLIDLGLGGNPLADLSPIAGLSRLRWLKLGWGGNTISDLGPVGQLANLQGLMICDAPELSDIGPLGALGKLEGLVLQRTQAADISPLSGVTSLVSVFLGANGITDVSSLSGLVNIRELDLCCNQLTEASSLSTLTSLFCLDLSENRFSVVPDLSDLSGLGVLDLSHNEIADISQLADMQSDYIDLDLEGNQISDISPLTLMQGLTCVDLRANPLDQDAYEIYIPMLEAQRVQVVYDPIPEPSLLVLLALGASTKLFRRRR